MAKMPEIKKNVRKVAPMKKAPVAKPKSGPAMRTTSGGGGNSKRAM